MAATAAAGNDDDDNDKGFWVQGGGGGGEAALSRKRKSENRRIYIGNLPQIQNLKVKLVDFINAADFQVTTTNVLILPNKSGTASCAALVPCSNVNRAIAVLHNAEFEGRKLVVQPERAKKLPKKSGKLPFGGSGWNRPSPTVKSTEQELSTASKERRPSTSMNETSIAFSNELELSQHLASIVANELEAAEEDPCNHGDVVNTMIASTAAMTLLSFVDAFGLDQCVTSTSTQQKHREADNANGGCQVSSGQRGDFLALSKKPLSELMADYGEQDLDFQKVIPTTQPEPIKSKRGKRQDYNNRLTLQGKAPIHVEVTSFGYMHGVPSDVRSGGWSHAHPLSPFDCRDLPQVPHYMARQDGLSPTVKRALLNAAVACRDCQDNDRSITKRGSDNHVRDCANDIGKQLFDALHEAITAGGYGHASPLRMTVHVGSECGRHRSVVVSELAATALRKLLRTNENNQITQPVSVGTRHRDIERRQKHQEQAVTAEKRSKGSKQIE